MGKGIDISHLLTKTSELLPAKSKAINTQNNNIFDGLTGEGQSLLDKATSANPQKGQACGNGIYDLDTGLISDLETLQSLVFDAHDDSVILTSNEDGTTTAVVDEDGDGIAEQIAVFDADGRKVSETIDQDEDGNADAIIRYDEEGNVVEMAIDKDSDGKIDYNEKVERIAGKQVNTVTEFWEEGESEGLRERQVQYVDGERTYMAKDNDGDGKWDYEAGEPLLHKELPSNSSSTRRAVEYDNEGKVAGGATKED